MMLLRHALAILALPFMVGVAVPFLLLQRQRADAPAMLQVPGLILVVLGLVLISHTVAHFARNGRGTLAPWDPPRDLVVSGVYRFTRNPMIAGVVLLLVGQSLFFGSARLGLWAASVLVVNGIYIPLVEEKRLALRFGAAYERYRHEVPRWVPRLSAGTAITRLAPRGERGPDTEPMRPTMMIADTIDIASPIDVVWRVTADVERWPEWTPTVTSVELLDGAPLRLGSVAAIKQPLQPVSNWVVVEFQPERCFAWETRRPGLRLKGVHDLTNVAGGTRNRLAVEATGILAILLWPILRIAVKKSLRDENAGLQRRCEQMSELSASE